MKTTSTVFGTFEAKTHLSEILDEVQNGAEITITNRGKPIARIIPYLEKKSKMSIKEIILKLTEIRNSVKGAVDIKETIREGRKH